MSRLKMTGFGRFVLFLLVLGPLTYFGVQYLSNSGALDQMKEKVENVQTERNQDPAEESAGDILDHIDRGNDQTARKTKEDLIAEQQRKIDELERQNQELKKSKDKPYTTSAPDILNQERPAPTTSNNDGGLSLDDLVGTAEDNMRSKGNTPSSGNTNTNSPNLGGTKKSLATWSFSFSSVSGTIELYQEGNKLKSRTAYNDRSRVDIHELTQRNDRLYVQNSPTGEYYVLKSDGTLDAYDEDGFQTTCRRL